jgi:hypothetical protein
MTWSQPQASLHPSLMTNAKYLAGYAPYYLSALQLSLSSLCDMTDQPTFAEGGGNSQPFHDAELFNAAHLAFTDAKSLQADWPAAARTNNFAFWVMGGMNYAVPAHSDFAAGPMPQKSARILLGQDTGSYPGGWGQYFRGLEAIRNAAYVELAAMVVMADPNAPPVLHQMCQRGLACAGKVRQIAASAGPSIEALLLQRAGL